MHDDYCNHCVCAAELIMTKITRVVTSSTIPVLDTLQEAIDTSSDQSPDVLRPINQPPLSLFKAAHKGDLEKVKKLVEKNDFSEPMQNESQTGGYSALHYAARSGQLHIVQYLIETKSWSHSPQSLLKETPLHIAARYGQFEVVRYLVCNQSVEPSDTDLQGLNALHHACIGGNKEIVAFLIDEMQKYNIPLLTLLSDKTNSGNAALHYASENGHEALVKFLIEERKCDKAIKGQGGITPLHIATQNGYLHIVKYLTEDQQCDPLCQDDNIRTPLHLAAME